MIKVLPIIIASFLSVETHKPLPAATPLVIQADTLTEQSAVPPKVGPVGAFYRNHITRQIFKEAEKVEPAEISKQ